MKNQKDTVVSVRLIRQRAEEITNDKKEKLLQMARELYRDDLPKTLDIVVEMMKLETVESNLHWAIKEYADAHNIPFIKVKEEYKKHE